MMLSYLNGELVPADQAKVSAFDRGFLYGDGLFETLRVQSGKLFRWNQHYVRLAAGLRLVRLPLAMDGAALRDAALQLIEANHFTHGILRLAVSRGVGQRGYSPRGAKHPTVLMQLYPGPDASAGEVRPVRLVTASMRVWADDPLAAIKSASKLSSIVARAESDERGAEDALLLNHRGEVAETSSGNLFWTRHDEVHTPALNAGILPGVTRAAVLELCAALSIKGREVNAGVEILREAEAMFVTSVGRGVVPVAELDGRRFERCELVDRLRAAFEELVASETR